MYRLYGRFRDWSENFVEAVVYVETPIFSSVKYLDEELHIIKTDNSKWLLIIANMQYESKILSELEGILMNWALDEGRIEKIFLFPEFEKESISESLN
jgi:hypothetical protein